MPLNFLIKKNIKLPEDPVFGTKYYLGLKKKCFMKVVPITKCCQNIFQNFFRPKNKVFGPILIPKKTFFEFFLRFLGDLVQGPNVKKWYFSDLATKGEKLNF